MVIKSFLCFQYSTRYIIFWSVLSLSFFSVALNSSAENPRDNVVRKLRIERQMRNLLYFIPVHNPRSSYLISNQRVAVGMILISELDLMESRYPAIPSQSCQQCTLGFDWSERIISRNQVQRRSNGWILIRWLVLILLIFCNSWMGPAEGWWLITLWIWFESIFITDHLSYVAAFVDSLFLLIFIDCAVRKLHWIRNAGVQIPPRNLTME